MATPNQISANRRNAEKSTGPKSRKGKKAVRHNALSHGLSASTQVLPGENQDDFDHLEQQFFSEFPPQNAVESFLLGEMVTCAWRLRRVAQVESGVFRYFQDKINHPPPRVVGIAGVSGSLFPPPGRENEEGISWTVDEETGFVLEHTEPALPATLGEAFLKASTEIDAFAKISRHEATIRAGFYRAYDELLNQRAARRGARSSGGKARSAAPPTPA